MHRLGGHVLGFSDSKMTRAGDFYQESIKDTFHMLEYYADVIAIRHFQQGAPHEAAKWASVPVINCGDGWGEHPTQVLTDLYTIRNEKGTPRRADLPPRRRHADADDALDPLRPVAVRRRGDRGRPARHVAPARSSRRSSTSSTWTTRRPATSATSSARPTSSTWSRSSRPTTPRRASSAPARSASRRRSTSSPASSCARRPSASLDHPPLAAAHGRAARGRRRHAPPALLGRGVQRRRAAGWRSSRSSSARRSRGPRCRRTCAAGTSSASRSGRRRRSTPSSRSLPS